MQRCRFNYRHGIKQNRLRLRSLGIPGRIVLRQTRSPQSEQQAQTRHSYHTLLIGLKEPSWSPKNFVLGHEMRQGIAAVEKSAWQRTYGVAAGGSRFSAATYFRLR